MSRSTPASVNATETIRACAKGIGDLSKPPDEGKDFAALTSTESTSMGLPVVTRTLRPLPQREGSVKQGRRGVPVRKRSYEPPARVASCRDHGGTLPAPFTHTFQLFPPGSNLGRSPDPGGQCQQHSRKEQAASDGAVGSRPSTESAGTAISRISVSAGSLPGRSARHAGHASAPGYAKTRRDPSTYALSPTPTSDSDAAPARSSGSTHSSGPYTDAATAPDSPCSQTTGHPVVEGSTDYFESAGIFLSAMT
jgi:hypothetical protein